MVDNEIQAVIKKKRNCNGFKIIDKLFYLAFTCNIEEYQLIKN